jgi:hypothetical protein
MKKLLLVVAFSMCSFNINAQHVHRHYHHHHHSGSNNWVAPAIIGGFLGYALGSGRVEAAPTAPPPVIYYEHPTISYSCPYGTRPVFNRVWTVDQWGRTVQSNHFIGCW